MCQDDTARGLLLVLRGCICSPAVLTGNSRGQGSPPAGFMSKSYLSSLPSEGCCRGHTAGKSTWFHFIFQRCLAVLCWHPVPICLGCSRQKEGQTSASCYEFDNNVFGSRQDGGDSRAPKPTEPGGEWNLREQMLLPHYHTLESGEDGRRAKEQQPQPARVCPHGQKAEGHWSCQGSPVQL